MRFHWIRCASLVAFLAAATLASKAEAQAPTPLQGRVVDAETRTPIPGAFVAFSGSRTGVLTDSLGFFLLPSNSPAPYRVRIGQLGYQELEREVTAETAGRPVMVLLSPDPIQMERLLVLVDRLAERRVGAYGPGEILTQAELLSLPDGSGYDLVYRKLPMAQPCDMETEALCLSGRGMMGERRRVTVCVDGQRVPPDFTETSLQGVQPQSLFLVEVYSRAGEVRMYSPGYVNRLMEAGMSLPPLSFGCGGVPG